MVGSVVAVDPDVVGGQFAKALEAIVCRCAHPTERAHPCPECADRFTRQDVRRMGRLLFAGIGVPLGRRAVTADEFVEAGWLLEQLERLAAGKLPRER